MCYQVDRISARLLRQVDQKLLDLIDAQLDVFAVGRIAVPIGLGWPTIKHGRASELEIE